MHLCICEERTQHICIWVYIGQAEKTKQQPIFAFDCTFYEKKKYSNSQNSNEHWTKQRNVHKHYDWLKTQKATRVHHTENEEISMNRVKQPNSRWSRYSRYSKIGQLNIAIKWSHKVSKFIIWTRFGMNMKIEFYWIWIDELELIEC